MCFYKKFNKLVKKINFQKDRKKTRMFSCHVTNSLSANFLYFHFKTNTVLEEAFCKVSLNL